MKLANSFRISKLSSLDKLLSFKYSTPERNNLQVIYEGFAFTFIVLFPPLLIESGLQLATR